MDDMPRIEEKRKNVFAHMAEWPANNLKESTFPNNYEMEKLIEESVAKHKRVLSAEELAREYRKRKEA